MKKKTLIRIIEDFLEWRRNLLEEAYDKTLASEVKALKICLKLINQYYEE